MLAQNKKHLLDNWLKEVRGAHGLAATPARSLALLLGSGVTEPLVRLSGSSAHLLRLGNFEGMPGVDDKS